MSRPTCCDHPSSTLPCPLAALPRARSQSPCLNASAAFWLAQEWDIEDEKFYENEGKQIGTRNLWASIPNLLLGFAVWLMWSVTIAKIQKAHSNDPSVYYFKDFAPEIEGVSEGFRGCPGWYLPSCCNTWKNADQEAFDAWQVRFSPLAQQHTRSRRLTLRLPQCRTGRCRRRPPTPRGTSP